MKTEHKIMAMSVTFGAFFWIIDAIMDYLLFHDGTLIGLLITSVPSLEVYMRSVVFVLFVAFGTVVSSVVTKRRQAEESLRESAERYRTLFVNTPLPYQALDEDGCLLDVNPAWLRTLGYDREEVIGRSFAEFLHPDWKPHSEENFSEFKRRGYVHDVKFEMRHKNGHHLLTSLEGCIGLSPDGRFRQTYCVFQDTSDRKRAEKALRENEELLRKIAENYPNSYVSIIEEDYTVGFTSGQEFRRRDLDPEQFIGLTLEQVLGGQQAGVVRQHYGQTFKGEECSFELFINDQYQLYRTVPLQSEDGSIHRILAVVENITERKRVEVALRESEGRFRNYVETSQHLIWECDAEGRFTYLNPAWEQVTGYRLSEMLGERYTDFIIADEVERNEAEFAKHPEGGYGRGYSATYMSKNGSKIHLVLNSLPLHDSSKNIIGTQGAAYDITQRVRMEAAEALHRESLRVEKERAQQYFDIAGVVLVVLDNTVVSCRSTGAAWNCSATKKQNSQVSAGTRRVFPKDCTSN